MLVMLRPQAAKLWYTCISAACSLRHCSSRKNRELSSAEVWCSTQGKQFPLTEDGGISRWL